MQLSARDDSILGLCRCVGVDEIVAVNNERVLGEDNNVNVSRSRCWSWTEFVTSYMYEPFSQAKYAEARVFTLCCDAIFILITCVLPSSCAIQQFPQSTSSHNSFLQETQSTTAPRKPKSQSSSSGSFRHSQGTPKTFMSQYPIMTSIHFLQNTSRGLLFASSPQYRQRYGNLCLLPFLRWHRFRGR